MKKSKTYSMHALGELL